MLTDKDIRDAVENCEWRKDLGGRNRQCKHILLVE